MFGLINNENGRALIPDAVVLQRNPSAAYAAGTALILSGGVAIAATDTKKPQYICCSNNAANDGSELVAYAVPKNARFETTVTAAPASLKVGDKVTLSTDGKGVTATTTDGVAVVVDLMGAKKSGDKIMVMFE